MPSYLPLLTTLLFLLPLSLLATPIPNSTHALPRPTANDPTAHDTLQITRCFCSSPNWAQDHVYGHHHHFQYHNAHLNRDYPITDTCISNKLLHSPANPALSVPECLFDTPKTYCTTPDIDLDNTFCIKLHPQKRWEVKFNKQRRKLPNGPSVREPVDRAEERCRVICDEEVDAMDLLGGEAQRSVKKGLYGGEGALTERDRFSHVEFYSGIDVMCPKCH